MLLDDSVWYDMVWYGMVPVVWHLAVGSCTYFFFSLALCSLKPPYQPTKPIVMYLRTNEWFWKWCYYRIGLVDWRTQKTKDRRKIAMRCEQEKLTNSVMKRIFVHSSLQSLPCNDTWYITDNHHWYNIHPLYYRYHICLHYSTITA